MAIQIFEKDIEDMLYKNPKKLGVDYWIERQFRVPSGVIDLLGVNCVPRSKLPIFSVYELKITEPKSEHLAQIYRYASDIENALLKRSEYYDEEHQKLAYPRVDKYVLCMGEPSNKILMEANAMNIDVKSFEFDVNGIKIHNSWCFTKEFRKEEENKLKEISLLDEINYAFVLALENSETEEPGEEYG